MGNGDLGEFRILQNSWEMEIWESSKLLGNESYMTWRNF